MIFRFRDCEVDSINWKLQRGGKVVTVQPKVFELLVHLLRHRDRVVPKKELLDAIWSDANVSESSLTRAVSLARRALGGEETTIINVPRRGYQFRPTVEVEEIAVDAPEVSTAPAALDDSVFVGREQILAELRHHWDAVVKQRTSRFVWITGSAGSGKTRTAEHFVSEVRGTAAMVAGVVCPPGRDRLPLDMWSRLASSAGDRAATDSGLAFLQMGESPLASDILEESGARRGIGLESIADGVQRWLDKATTDGPAILYMDDVQWADPASLRLLELVADTLDSVPVLVLLAMRDEGLEIADPAPKLLSQMSSRRDCARLHQEALSVDEVERLFIGMTGWKPDAGVASDLERRTRGNPLFVVEILRNLHGERSLLRPRSISLSKLKLPANVRGVIATRLGLLPDTSLGLLKTAAFVGQQFEAGVLEHMTSQSADDVLTNLDVARTASVIRASEGEYRFCHPLLHEVLEESIGDDRIVELHQKAADALETVYAHRRDQVVARLATHYSTLARESVPGVLDRAIEATRRCAELAAERSAFDEAAGYYHDAFELADQFDAASAVDRRVDLLIREARTLAWGDELETGLQRAEQAAKLSAKYDKHEALALGSQSVRIPGGEAFAGMFHRALALLEDGERRTRGSSSLARAGCLARLARAVYFLPDSMSRRLELCAEAEEIAATHVDAYYPALLLDVSISIWAREPAGTKAARLQRIFEMVERNDPQLHIAAEIFPVQMLYLIEQGDVAGVESYLERFRQRLAAHTAPTFYRSHPLAIDVMLHLLRGNLVEAEEILHDVIALNQRWKRVDFLQYIGAQFAVLRFEQGRTAEVAALLQTARSGLSYNSGWRAGGISAAVATGSYDDARRELRTWFAEGLPVLRDDANAPSAFYHLAYACSRLGERDVATELYQRALPVADSYPAVLAAVVCYGSMHLVLGWLAGGAGNPEAAVDHLQQALRRHQKIGARTALARTHQALAEQQAALGLHDRSVENRRKALELAEAVGMQQVAEEVRTALESSDRP